MELDCRHRMQYSVGAQDHVHSHVTCLCFVLFQRLEQQPAEGDKEGSLCQPLITGKIVSVAYKPAIKPRQVNN